MDRCVQACLRLLLMINIVLLVADFYFFFPATTSLAVTEMQIKKSTPKHSCCTCAVIPPDRKSFGSRPQILTSISNPSPPEWEKETAQVKMWHEGEEDVHEGRALWLCGLLFTPHPPKKMGTSVCCKSDSVNIFTFALTCVFCCNKMSLVPLKNDLWHWLTGMRWQAQSCLISHNLSLHTDPHLSSIKATCHTQIPARKGLGARFSVNKIVYLNFFMVQSLGLLQDTRV